MIGLLRRRPILLLTAALILSLGLLLLWDDTPRSSWLRVSYFPDTDTVVNWQIPDDYFWKRVPVNHPPTSIRPLPTGAATRFPKVQADDVLRKETAEESATRIAHRDAVRAVFQKCWNAYKANAWMSDELMPVSGGKRNPFGGWGATLVDSLDTLWIMGLRDEFEVAAAAAETIDFTHSSLDQVNVFETTIRYLGGFLSAYDLSGDARLLRKAVEVGEMLLKAFDTPNRMPITRWEIQAAMDGKPQVAPEAVLSAEIGSLTMEFSRLSIITGEAKWFDATQRITDIFAAQQMTTSLAGMWPLVVNAKDEHFDLGDHFTLGAMADSLYEYLPKMAALMGGKLPEYQTMYERAMDVAEKWLLFRPMTPTNEDILIAGSVRADPDQTGNMIVRLDDEGQHLVCFVGGLYALGGKLFGRKKHVELANKLVDGCVYTYKASQHGIMPETFHMVPCPSKDDCHWDEMAWRQHVVSAAGESDMAKADAIIAEKNLPKGFSFIGDARYILRPEAIESVFILYRATGRRDLLDAAWDMFTAINEVTSTGLANSAVSDVTKPEKPTVTDSMESFWLGETLKYFYLVFSEPTLVSLDEYVFNTEAHPFKRLIR